MSISIIVIYKIVCHDSPVYIAGLAHQLCDWLCIRLWSWITFISCANLHRKEENRQIKTTLIVNNIIH